MSEIHIKYMSDEAVSTVKANIENFTKLIELNPVDNSAVVKELPENAFTEKKYVIEDFSLKCSPDGNYENVDFGNAVILYEHLNKLPNHVLGDEKFWAWIYFDKCYAATVQAMPMNSGKNIIRAHWFYDNGLRRSIFFGVLSRAYFRVALAVEPYKEDKYELVRFATKKYERYRNLTWRSFSSRPEIVRATLRAEKRVVDQFGENIEVKNYYTEIAKYVSQLGSVMLLDDMDEGFIEEKVHKKCLYLVEGSV